MTNKEAIEILKNYHNGYFGYKIDDVHEAHNLAIKALEWQYKMQYGDCDYCKHKNYASFKYPCTACSKDNEMWEEANNETN